MGGVLAQMSGAPERAKDPRLIGAAMLLGIAAIPLLGYVMLCFPDGRLHSRLERWVIAGSGAVIALCWIPLVFITRQPMVATPLLSCAPHCPHNGFLLRHISRA